MTQSNFPVSSELDANAPAFIPSYLISARGAQKTGLIPFKNTASSQPQSKAQSKAESQSQANLSKNQQEQNKASSLVPPPAPTAITQSKAPTAQATKVIQQNNNKNNKLQKQTPAAKEATKQTPAKEAPKQSPAPKEAPKQSPAPKEAVKDAEKKREPYVPMSDEEIKQLKKVADSQFNLAELEVLSKVETSRSDDLKYRIRSKKQELRNERIAGSYITNIIKKQAGKAQILRSGKATASPRHRLEDAHRPSVKQHDFTRTY